MWKQNWVLVAHPRNRKFVRNPSYNGFLYVGLLTLLMARVIIYLLVL